MREIKFNFIYGIDGETENYFNKSFTFAEIENGDHFDEISDSPLLKKYTILAKRQYTGSKDKNGVEIYEGDICRGHNQDYKDPHAVEVIGIISWNGFEGAYSFDQKGVDWMMDISDSLEVISNIYQNPHTGEEND